MVIRYTLHNTCKARQGKAKGKKIVEATLDLSRLVDLQQPKVRERRILPVAFGTIAETTPMYDISISIAFALSLSSYCIQYTYIESPWWFSPKVRKVLHAGGKKGAKKVQKRKKVSKSVVLLYLYLLVAILRLSILATPESKAGIQW